MSLDLHTVSVAAGSAAPTKQDRVQQWSAFGLATAAGAAGVAVATVVPVPAAAGFPSNGNYFVDVEVAQDVTYFISAKSATGFTVTLNPRLPANIVAAGAFNVNVTF